MAEIRRYLENPFVVESPEKLDVEEVYDLFVRENSGVEVVQQRKHAFIWGPRGSGKSMLLRYLEPKCQAIRFKEQGETWEKGMHRFIEGEAPFLGIRIACKEGYFNKTELEMMDKASAQILTEHMMNLSLASATLSVLDEQFPGDFFTKEAKIKLARGVSRLFNSASIGGSLNEASADFNIEVEPFKWTWRLFDAELRNLQEYLRQQALPQGKVRYQGATSGYHDFLLPFARIVQGLIPDRRVPLYFFIDDADRLKVYQQQIVNSWMANRDLNVICIKTAAQFHEYRTMMTRDGSLLESPHDYTEFSIEALYSSTGDSYTEKIRAIVSKRLSLAGVKRTPDEFLQPDPEQEQLLKKMKDATAAEWEKVGKPGRQNDYVHRYAVPRLFQELKRTRQRRNYAGFENLVHLSSGVARYFLEPCYLMFEELLQQQSDQIKLGIPPALQRDVIYKYSEEFVLDLEKIRKDLKPEKFGTLDRLSVLLNSLGRLFYENLTNPESRDARLFSFTVRGQLSAEARDVLDLAKRYRYFQLRTYSTKEGGGRELWYVLNRRLCPVYKLDPTGFGGRLSLQSVHLDLAMRDTDRFVTLRLKAGEDLQEDLFSLEASA
jgi:hypothetical protein